MGESDEEMTERHEPDPDHRVEEPHGGRGREHASFSFRPDDEAEDLVSPDTALGQGLGVAHDVEGLLAVTFSDAVEDVPAVFALVEDSWERKGVMDQPLIRRLTRCPSSVSPLSMDTYSFVST